MENLSKVLKIAKLAKQSQLRLASVKDKYSSMFLLVDASKHAYIGKKDGKDIMTTNKALASRFTYEAAKKEKEKWPGDIQIVDEVSEVVINDSVKDSPASEVVSAIKRQYPQVNIEQYFIKKNDHDVFKLRIDNAPGVDRFDHTKSVSFERFVEHLLKQHGFDYISVGTHDKTVYADAYFDRRTNDSCKDEQVVTLEKVQPSDTNGSKEELEDIKIMPYGRVTKSQWEAFLHKAKWPYWLDWEQLVNETSHDSCKDGISPMTYKKLKELGYESKDWENWSDEEKVKRSQQSKVEKSEEGSKKDLFPEQKEGTWIKISKRQLEEKIKLSEEDKSKLRKQGFLQNYHGYDIEQGNNEDIFYVYKQKGGKSTDDSVHDELDASDIDDLIAEEYEAIADYEAAISECSSERAKADLEHILNEEKEHVKELEELKEKGVKTLVDTKDGGMREYVYNIQHPELGGGKKRHTPTPNQKAFEKHKEEQKTKEKTTDK